MTTRPGKQASCRALRCGVQGLCLLLGLIAAPAQAADTSRAALESLVRAQALASNPWSGHDTQVDVGPLDERLQLPPCQGRLETFLPPGSSLGSRGSIGVRCTDTGGWKLFVPVTLHVSVPVMVATAVLQPGSELDRGKTRMEPRDISSLPYGFLDDRDPQVRYRVRTLVSVGSVITPTLVDVAPLIARGQRVSLVSTGSGLNVSMQGEALGDGAPGARIQVRNLQSGRIVEGRVAGPDRVEMP